MGDTDAVQWEINIYLDEKLFDTISVDVLSAGTLLHVTSDPWVATPGNHTVHFVLDAENHVDESNEDNNVMSKLFIVKLPVLNGEPTIVDIMGRPSQPTVGQMAIVQSEVRNIDTVPRDFTFIVQVKNPQGVVEYLSFITGSVNPGQSLTPGVSWTPQTSGEYVVETYVWKSFDEPIVLSESVSKEISVAG